MDEIPQQMLHIQRKALSSVWDQGELDLRTGLVPRAERRSRHHQWSEWKRYFVRCYNSRPSFVNRVVNHAEVHCLQGGPKVEIPLFITMAWLTLLLNLVLANFSFLSLNFLSFLFFSTPFKLCFVSSFHFIGMLSVCLFVCFNIYLMIYIQ